MRIHAQIHFHGMEASPALRETIKQHAEKLAQFAPDIQSCRVVVERVNRRQRRGSLYQVKLHLNLPGCVIAAGETHVANQAHEDAHVAVRVTFDAARRQLEDFEQKRRGEVKHHSSVDTGQIIAMDREQGIGALITGDGNELLFYRYTMVGTEFDQLMEGQIVRFVTISDADGVRAEIVQVSAPPAYHHHTPART